MPEEERKAVDSQTEDGQRSDDRINSRNGYRDRAYETRVGKVDLQDPQAAQRQLFSRLSRATAYGRKSTHSSHPGGHIEGIATHSVDELVKAMGMSDVSKSQVSRLCEEIDERVQTLLNRPIEGD